MFHRSILAAAALATLVGGAAIAQGTPPQPPTPPSEPGRAPPPPPPPGHGPDGMRGMGPGGMPPGGPGGPHGMRPMPMGKGTFVNVSKDGSVMIKCADDESTKDCMEAAGPVLDKLRAPR